MSFPWWADHADRSLRPIARSPCRLLKLARVRQLRDAPSDRQGMLSTVFGIAGPADEDMRRTLGVFAGPGFYWFSLGLTCLFADLRRIGIVSAFDPELKAVEQAIIPENAESKIKQVNGTRFRLVDLYGKHLYFFLW